jgi:hypothetical protein
VTGEALALDRLFGFVRLFVAFRAFGVCCCCGIAGSDYRGLQFYVPIIGPAHCVPSLRR